MRVELRKDQPRKLRRGELVDVWLWPRKEKWLGTSRVTALACRSGLMRLKGKSREDGQVGWVTSVGNAGTIFLEVGRPRWILQVPRWYDQTPGRLCGA